MRSMPVNFGFAIFLFFFFAPINWLYDIKSTPLCLISSLQELAGLSNGSNKAKDGNKLFFKFSVDIKYGYILVRICLEFKTICYLFLKALQKI